MDPGALTGAFVAGVVVFMVVVSLGVALVDSFERRHRIAPPPIAERIT